MVRPGEWGAASSDNCLLRSARGAVVKGRSPAARGRSVASALTPVSTCGTMRCPTMPSVATAWHWRGPAADSRVGSDQGQMRPRPLWPRKEIPSDDPRSRDHGSTSMQPLFMSSGVRCSLGYFTSLAAVVPRECYAVVRLARSRSADLLRGGYVTTLTITHSETIQTRVELSSDDPSERNITPPHAPRSSRVPTWSPRLRGVAAATPDSTDDEQ